MEALFSLVGKRALVTGGASGIGQALAHALAKAGADVAVTVHSQPAVQTRELVEAAGRKFLDIPCDLAVAANTRSLIGDVTAQFGTIDILINNAGIIRRNDLSEFCDADWDDVLEVNLNAVWQLTQEVANHMGTCGGKIINVASLLSFQGGIRVPSYTASKHAVLGLTKACANELAAKNINVNCIAPGYIATANTEGLRNDPLRNRQILERIPAGRWGKAADLSGAAVFLASAASDYVHGQVIVVDGGWMAR